MNSSTKLTCLEYIITKRHNEGVLKLFRTKIRATSNLPERKDIRTYQEWETAFNEFLKQ